MEESKFSQNKWSDEATLQLISLWRDFECLYDPKNQYYHNKHARQNALSEITEKLQVFCPGIGTADVKTKITYLRGQYTREVAKIKERKSGSGADDVYSPTVFWFSELYFLEDHLKIRKGSCNLITPTDDFSENSSQTHEFITTPVQSKKRCRVQNDTPNYSHEESVIEAATDALRSYATTKSQCNQKIESFVNFIKAELNDLSIESIQDDLIETITLAVFKAKKNQKMFKLNIEFCPE